MCLFIYVAFASEILAHGGATPRNGHKTDNAHPPIHPTKHTNHLQVFVIYCCTHSLSRTQDIITEGNNGLSE